jgi:CheY-like chemotaxis protein
MYKKCALVVPHGTTEPLKILAVDDDLSLLKLYEIILGRWPMSPLVTLAENGAQALQCLASDCPDILILDLHLSDMNGLKMVHELRAKKQFESTLMIVVSGMSAFDVDKQGGLPANVLYMRKPVQFEQLLSLALEQALAKNSKARLDLGNSHAFD